MNKKTIITIIVILLLSGLGAYYYLQEEEILEKRGEYVNCGISGEENVFEIGLDMYQFNEKEMKEIEEEVFVLSCLGEHILNDCKKAQAKVIDKEGKETLFFVEGKNEVGFCEKRWIKNIQKNFSLRINKNIRTLITHSTPWI